MTTAPSSRPSASAARRCARVRLRPVGLAKSGTEIERLHRAAAGAGAIGGRRAIAAAKAQPVVARLVGGKRLQRAEIGRIFDEQGIARRQQRLAEEVEALLRAGGDEDVVRRRRDAGAPHLRRDPGAQRLVALADAVLQRRGGLAQRLGIGGARRPRRETGWDRECRRRRKSPRACRRVSAVPGFPRRACRPCGGRKARGRGRRT